MSESALKQRLTDDMKTAMRAGEKERLSAIRFILAACKQKEVDERVVLTDADIIAILSKMLTQRKDAAAEFEKLDRADLAEKEKFDINLIEQYLPEPLPETELNDIINQAIVDSGAKTIKEMSAVMNVIRPKIQGRADMALVSKKIKELLQ
jgi:uncharacterized protein YqeY